MDNTNNIKPGFYTDNELRNVIRQLWNETIMWTRFLIISKVSKLKDIEVVTNRLLQNPIDFAYVLRIYYGGNIANEFENLLREHLNLTIKLIDSYVSKNSTIGSSSIEKQWYDNANQLASFLSSINPYWDKQTLINAFNNHLDMTKDEIQKRLYGQYSADVDAYDFITYHTLMIADIMADGIIKQFYNSNQKK